MTAAPSGEMKGYKAPGVVVLELWRSRGTVAIVTVEDGSEEPLRAQIHPAHKIDEYFKDHPPAKLGEVVDAVKKAAQQRGASEHVISRLNVNITPTREKDTPTMATAPLSRGNAADPKTAAAAVKAAKAIKDIKKTTKKHDVVAAAKAKAAGAKGTKPAKAAAAKPASTRGKKTEVTLKGKNPKPTEGMGSGLYIRNLVMLGHDTETILGLVKANFKDSTAKPSDVSWNKGKLKKEGFKLPE